MGFMAFMNLDGPDIAAFVVTGIIGYFAGLVVPAGAWSNNVSILVSYHLFLAWLIVSTEKKTGASLPITPTIVTHLACLAIILPLGIGGGRLPFFSIFRYGIASLAIFERGWLFSGKTGEPKREEAPTPGVVVASTADDFQEWQRYLAQQKPGSRKMGSSLKTEYEQWLLARAKNRPTEAASQTELTP
jgi:hypothetical protein